LTGVSENEEKKNTTPFRCFSPERYTTATKQSSEKHLTGVSENEEKTLLA